MGANKNIFFGEVDVNCFTFNVFCAFLRDFFLVMFFFGDRITPQTTSGNSHPNPHPPEPLTSTRPSGRWLTRDPTSHSDAKYSPEKLVSWKNHRTNDFNRRYIFPGSPRPNKVAGLLDDPCKGFPILPMGKVWSNWTSWVFIHCSFFPLSSQFLHCKLGISPGNQKNLQRSFHALKGPQKKPESLKALATYLGVRW